MLVEHPARERRHVAAFLRHAWLDRALVAIALVGIVIAVLMAL